MNNEETYFNFPLEMMSNMTFGLPVDMESILHFSIYKHYHEKMNGDDDDCDSFERCANFFNVNLGNPERALKNGINLYNQFKPLKLPYTSIKASIYWDYHNNVKTDWENVLLLAYLAFKSILGLKPYCNTNNRFLLARMDCSATSKKHKLKAFIAKRSSRYYCDLIRAELQRRWNVKFYSKKGMRGYYFTFDMELEELKKAVDEKKMSTKDVIREFHKKIREFAS